MDEGCFRERIFPRQGQKATKSQPVASGKVLSFMALPIHSNWANDCRNLKLWDLGMRPIRMNQIVPGLAL